MPTYEHECNDCKKEFEDFYSISAPLPPCPHCGSGNVLRLISGGSGKGVVELTGQELLQKTKDDVKAMKARARTDENFRANLIGEARYNNLATKRR